MSLNNIDHVVVLVMENRSFDHLLGYRFGDPSSRRNPKQMPDNTTVSVAPMKLASSRFTPGPNHTYVHVARQINVQNGVPTMSGFVSDYASVDGVTCPEMAMGYYDQHTVMAYDHFANDFLVCDRWFSALPGPTLPNRCFLLAGHSAGIVENGHLALHLLTHGMTTLFDVLGEQDVSWRSYFHDAPFLWLFRQFLFKRDNIRPIKEFYDDAKNGTLAAVTWLDPNFTLQGAVHLPGDPILPGDPTLPDAANDDHPPADVTRGQMLAFAVYKALREGPRWNKTLFIVTYDEHGGFYDSAPPPSVPSRARMGNPAFNRFGVRVPAFLISPWVPKGAASALPGGKGVDFEHTSIARTILDRFCPAVDKGRFGERLAGAPSLASLLGNVMTPRGTPPDIAFASVAGKARDAVGGFSAAPAPLRVLEQPGDFHKMMAGLAALAAGNPDQG